MFISVSLVTILIVILILKINITLSKQKRKVEKFNIVEAIFTIIFGVLGLLYLLVAYHEEILD